MTRLTLVKLVTVSVVECTVASTQMTFSKCSQAWAVAWVANAEAVVATWEEAVSQVASPLGSDELTEKQANGNYFKFKSKLVLKQWS